MSLFPDALYRTNIADVQARQLDPLIRRVELAAAAVAVAAFFTVDPDHVLILQSAHLLALPGAAQNFAAGEITIHSGVGVIARLKADYVARAVGQVHHFDWQGSIIVPSNALVHFSVNFNAGAAANTTSGSIVGMLIPRGNVERL